MSWIEKLGTYAAGPMVYANKWAWDQINKKSPSVPPQKFNSSAYGRALPLVWGKTRITGNVIHLTNPQPGTTNYTTDAIVALCEGPISWVGATWRGQDYKTTPAAFGWTIMPGDRPQAPWSRLTTNHPEQAIGYPGVTYLYRQSLELGASTLTGFSYEVSAFRVDTGGDGGDAHPALMLIDFFSEAYGLNLPGKVEVQLGQDGTADSSCWRYVQADGLWISPALIEQRDASEHLSEILECINCDLLWKEGKFYILPICDVPVTGNGVTYSPAVNVQYALGPSDFMVDGAEDPIAVELEPLDATYNVAPVEYLERTAAGSDPSARYNASVVESPEPTDISRNGVRRAEPAVMHAICRRDVATKISRIRAQRMCWTRTTFRFRLPWRFCRLEPMDLVSLTDPLLGLAERVVRIEKITEDADFGLTIEAVEWVFGTAGATLHDTQSNESTYYVPDPVAWEPAQRDLRNVPDKSVGEPMLDDGSVSERTFAVDSLRSTNYVPGGAVGTDSEWAQSGVKVRRNDGLAEGAPALLVDPRGLKIGETLVDDAWFGKFKLCMVRVTHDAGGWHVSFYGAAGSYSYSNPDLTLSVTGWTGNPLQFFISRDQYFETTWTNYALHRQTLGSGSIGFRLMDLTSGTPTAVDWTSIGVAPAFSIILADVGDVWRPPA